MPTIRGPMQHYIEQRLDDGLSRHEIFDIAQKAAGEAQPAQTMQALMAQYGDSFTNDGAQAYRALLTNMQCNGPESLGNIFIETIASLHGMRTAIKLLSDNITRLEQQHTEKSRKADNLVQQIESRKAEIKRNREQKRTIGMLGACFGMNMVAMGSLMTMYQDDARLRTLERSLNDARQERQSITAQLEQYAQKKEVLFAKLATFQAAEKKLEMNHSRTESTPQNIVQVAAASSQLDRNRALLENLQQQAELLKSVRNIAQEVGLNLDQLISCLEQRVSQAQQLVQASEKSLCELVDIITAPDPEATAEQWLNKQVAQKTAQVLKELKLNMRTYIKHLVQDAFPNGGRAADELSSQLFSKFKEVLG